MSPAQEQFDRIRRYSSPGNPEGVGDEHYYDDVLAFFVHAWHMIDWTGNDLTLGLSVERVRKDAMAKTGIARCQDIANHTKHLELDRPRRSPPMTNVDVYAWDGAVDRPFELYFTFKFPDGFTSDALSLARQGVGEWQSLLRTYGVVV